MYNVHKQSKEDQVSFGNGWGAKYFAAATKSARKGQYTEAGKLLDKALAEGECSEVQALDLYARMYAQQGLYLEAESCWRKAKALDGSNPSFDKSIERLRRGRPSMDRFIRTVPYLALLFALSVILWQQKVIYHDLGYRLSRAEDSLSGLRGEIAAARSESEHSVRKVGSSVADLDKALNENVAKLTMRIEALPTADDLSKNLKAITDGINDEIVHLRKTVVDNDSHSRARDKKMSTQISEIDSRLHNLQDQLREQTDKLSKASQTAQDWDLMIKNLNGTLKQVAEAVQSLKSNLLNR